MKIRYSEFFKLVKIRFNEIPALNISNGHFFQVTGDVVEVSYNEYKCR